MPNCSRLVAFDPARCAGLAALLGAALLASTPCFAADCPAALVHVEKYEPIAPFLVDAFAYDSTITLGVSSTHIQFDRMLGRTAFTANSSGRLLSSVRIIETFHVTGVPPGTPVDAAIEFRLNGWSEQGCGGSGCGVQFEGRLETGGNSAQADANHWGPTIGPRTLDAVLHVPVRLVAGEPLEAQFSIAFGTGAGGGAHAELTGSFGVVDLPPGTSAFACSDATPVRGTSWGRIKTLYR